MKPAVLVTHWVHPEVIRRLETACEVVSNPTRETWPRERVIELASRCDAMLAFLPDCLDDAFLARCPKLRIVAGALKGTDNFDVPAGTRRGVWLTRVPDLLSAPSADLAIGLLVAITRNFLAGDDRVRGGEFRGWRPQLYGTGLSGKTLGLVGYGSLGRAVAERAGAFRMRIVVTDPRAPAAPHERLPLDTLLAASDFVMPLVPVTPQTRNLLGAEAIGRMKRGAYLVNVGRGSVVDERAVAGALASGRLAGYAADVFEMEELAYAARSRAIPAALLADRQRTFFTPHLGSAVREARLAIELEAAESILDALAGRRPRGAINEPADRSGGPPVGRHLAVTDPS
jgi:phosphonate dehydrogenase